MTQAAGTRPGGSRRWLTSYDTIAASELRLHRWRTISVESLTVEREELSLFAFLSN